MVLYGKGISKASEILDIGVSLGVIEKSGSWFSYDGQRIGQGKDNARQYIESEPELMQKLSETIRLAAGKVELEEEFGSLAEEGEDEFDLRDFEVGDSNG